MEYPKLLISGSFNVFNESWNSAGVYMASGLYISQTFKQPIYIGSTVDLQIRIEDNHIYDLNQDKHPHNPPFQNAWNKYGQENFVWWLLETCEPEKTLEVEQKYLDLYRPFVDEFGGFNIAHFAESGMKGRKHTEESKKKLSENHMGQRNSPKTEFKNGQLPWNKNGTHTEETKKKISKIIQEKIKNGELDEKFKKDSMRKLEAYRSGVFNPRRGKRHSEGSKKRISESHLGNEFITKRAKRVLCIETKIIYPSSHDAAKKLNLYSTNISKTCNGKHKTCGGYHWKYVENNKND